MLTYHFQVELFLIKKSAQKKNVLYYANSLLPCFKSFVPECNELKAVENKMMQNNFTPSTGNRTENLFSLFSTCTQLAFSTAQKIMKTVKSQVIMKQNNQLLQPCNFREVH